MLPLAIILSVLTFLAGWFYLFHSRAAVRLGALEDQAINQRRIRLRRVNGFVMLLLSVGFFALFWMVAYETGSSMAFALISLAVFVLLFVVVILVMIDLRLTLKLRAARNRQIPGEPPGESDDPDAR